jgi:hypothetical protein
MIILPAAAAEFAQAAATLFSGIVLLFYEKI